MYCSNVRAQLAGFMIHLSIVMQFKVAYLWLQVHQIIRFKIKYCPVKAPCNQNKVN